MSKNVVRTNPLFPSVFNDFFKPWNEWFDGGNVWNVPAVNISESKDAYKVSLAVPGMKKEDFKIDLDGNMLTISSEKKEEKEEKDEKFTRKEYSFSSFSRSFTVPDDIEADKIAASYKDGVLELKLPKKEPAKKAEAKKIEIK
ncbi:MAG: Hsp20/alpha crystallin family protein [Saprospiraceae bacterium]|nr:Hsp20/alpha crystallin family protein [Saprospiraceae bacterium]